MAGSIERADRLIPASETAPTEALRLSPEQLAILENGLPFVFGHYYQPQRICKVENGDAGEVIFNITGGLEKPPRDFNREILAQSLVRVLRKGILAKKEMGFDLPGITRDYIKENEPALWEEIKEAAKINPPAGDLYYHTLGPLKNRRDKEMAVKHGIRAYEEDFGRKPDLVWLPEAAVDEETLDVLAENGVKGVFLREDQVIRENGAPVCAVKTPHGPIMVIVFNKDLSGQLAFSKYDGDIEAYGFARKMNLAQVRDGGFVLPMAVDGETFGHHHGENSIKFLESLLKHALPEEAARLGLTKEDFKIKPDQVKEAKVVNFSSWSCEHKLSRWTAAFSNCDCDCGGNNEKAREVRKTKRNLVLALWRINREVDQRLDQKAAQSGVPWEGLFINWLLSQRRNIGKGEAPSVENVDPDYKEDFLKKWLAWGAGDQSCARFRGVVDYERSSLVAVLAKLTSTENNGYLVASLPPEKIRTYKEAAHSLGASLRIIPVGIDMHGKQQYLIAASNGDLEKIREIAGGQKAKEGIA